MVSAEPTAERSQVNTTTSQRQKTQNKFSHSKITAARRGATQSGELPKQTLRMCRRRVCRQEQFHTNSSSAAFVPYAAHLAVYNMHKEPLYPFPVERPGKNGGLVEPREQGSFETASNLHTNDVYAMR